MRPRRVGPIFWALIFGLRCGPAIAGPIERAAKKYNIDPKILWAIYHIETSGGRNVRLKTNKNRTQDKGPFQINSVHWHTNCKAYDVGRLDGASLCAAKLLARHRRAAPHDPYWMGRYHSTTLHRKINYAKKIQQYIKGVSK